MRILVIAPHADDETLGCGGMIARRVAEGHAVDVVVAVVSDVWTAGQKLKNSAARRRLELAEAARILGVARHEVFLDEGENRLDALPELELVVRLDAVLARADYDQVFIPYASHHQDHRAVHRACISALRPGTSAHRPALVALYEYPYVGWSGEPAGGRLYCDISRHIECKLAALRAYASQLGEPPHPLSLDAVRRLASARGVECGVEHAELFYVLRMLD